MFVVSLNLSANDNSAALNSKQNELLTIEYNVNAEFDISPLIVSKDFFSLSIGGDVGFGVRFNEKYLVGLIFGAGYYTLGALPSDILNGAELVFRWTIFGATRFTEWFSLYYGLGVSLCFSSYGIAHLGYIPATSVGPVLHIEPRFYIPQFRYIDFAVIADADLRIGDYWTPTVYGGGRVNFHPYIKWLSLFVELGGRYELYQNDNIRLDLGHFVLSAGVSLDLFIRHKDKSRHSKTTEIKSSDDGNDIQPNVDNDKDKTKATEQPTETKTESKKEEQQSEPKSEPKNENKKKAEELTNVEKTKLVSEMDDDTKAEYKELIEELEKQTGAKVVSFSDVLFAPNTDDMLEGNEIVLDSVVLMLKENGAMRLNLCGYTNNVGNKKQELKLSKKRVNKVVDYLTANGVSETRLEVAAYGGENVKRAGINKENRRVEIRVLEDKQ